MSQQIDNHNSGVEADQRIWLTGASSGIGAALAEQLMLQGYSLVLTARNEEKLQDLKEALEKKKAQMAYHSSANTRANARAQAPRIDILAMDISDDSAVAEKRRLLAELAPDLAAIYMCAGVCEYLNFDSQSCATDDWPMVKRVHSVNFLGSVNCIEMALPLLKGFVARTQTQAHIVGLSSLALLMPFTRAEAYGSSKAALHYLLLSLAMDLKPHQIAVTSVLPGFVETPMTDQNNFSMPFIMSPSEAAKRICRGVANRPRVFAFPKRLYLLLKFFSFFPGLWFKKMSPQQEAVK
ncbi:Fatty acyl-CoA reductase [Thalassocella blandensis]|nr:Fatty acyl-CoA reductase [Thalassocella blandensis]